ncbi:NUDIX hydrolase [Streptacidiphilus monticola]|uniref:NUDIX hydrolase n=1 Tax=Streptacidiphilus monticola TaxID=2161674 RepID=A0ABW1FY91_9ACTN
MTEQGEQQGIAAAIVVHDRKVLMVRRRVAEGELVWQFPAGAMEAGESAEQTAEREAFEETGLSVDAMMSLGEREHPVTGRQMAYVVCAVITGEAHVADPDELAAVAWVSHAELADYVPSGLFEPVQEYLDQHLAV